MTPGGRSSVRSLLYRLGTGLVLPLSALAVLSWLIPLDALGTEPFTRVSLPVIGKGTLLVAHPGLQDQNFRHTVVLICEHGPDGTLGLILNQPTGVLLADVLPGLPVLKGTTYVLFKGGPVEPDRIIMLFRLTGPPGPLKNIFENVYLGSSREALERVITNPQPTETFRAYAGYAGWVPGQLEFEIATGAWATVPAESSSVIFDKAPEAIWTEMMELLQAPRVIGVKERRGR